MPISKRNICSFQLRKICWQRIMQEDFVVVRKKLKRTPQRKGLISLGYNQTSRPFKRREPKPCSLRWCPLSPKPEPTPPQERRDSAQLERSNQSLDHPYRLRTPSYTKKAYLGSSLGKSLQLPREDPKRPMERGS